MKNIQELFPSEGQTLSNIEIFFTNPSRKTTHIATCSTFHGLKKNIKL